LTIAAHAREHHYSTPPGTNVTHSSPRRHQKRQAHRVRLLSRLPRREWENHPLAIAAAIPHGSVRAAGQVRWMAAVRASPALAHRREDAWASTLRVVRSLALTSDWQLGTTRPTWERLMADSGMSRRTVARILARLRDAGLLGVVATGRSAGTDPMALDDGASAAVYVLTHPAPLRPVAPLTPEPHPATQPSADPQQPANTSSPAEEHQSPTRPFSAVDISGTPSLSPLVTAKDQPTHAREQSKKELASSPSALRNLTRAELIAAGQLCDSSEQALWTTKGRRFLAAAELRRRDPIIGRLSTPDVASVLREWLLDPRWSVQDIHHALNHRPDGTPWPHQLTVADVVDVRGWMRYRLNAWRQNPLDPASPPASSRSAQADADQKRALARARARAEAETLARATWMPAADRSPAAEAAVTAARAEIRRANLTRKHRKA
jgi:hypothetical protein